MGSGNVTNWGSIADWFVAIVTLFLGGVAVFQDRIRAWAWGPKLDCEIELKPPTCHRTIESLINKETKQVIAQFFSYYLRFKVWNRGEISAEKVEVILTDIFKKEGTQYKAIESFSLANLVWSVTDKEDKRKIYWDYISPETYKYCNLGHIFDPKSRRISGEDRPELEVKEDEIIFCFDVYFRSSLLYHLVRPGVYKFKIKVGCANAKTITQEYKLEITGKWNEDESKMLKEELAITRLW